MDAINSSRKSVLPFSRSHIASNAFYSLSSQSKILDTITDGSTSAFITMKLRMYISEMEKMRSDKSQNMEICK